MQRLVNRTYRSRSFKKIYNSITRRVYIEAFLVTKYRYSKYLNIKSTVSSLCMLNENIYSQLYYTKVLNECKF